MGTKGKPVVFLVLILFFILFHCNDTENRGKADKPTDKTGITDNENTDLPDNILYVVMHK